MSSVEERLPEPAGRDVDGHALIELERLSKFFGNIIALQNITTSVQAGEVTCVLGDNGAGKSTFIKILAGVHGHDEGRFLMDGSEVKFHSPREAKAAGIATVYQDLAMAPLMSVWRNFWLGSEPTTWLGTIDMRKARDIAVEELAKMGIYVRDPEQPVGTLSGGERQSVAIARAVYFGAKVLILDEPTAALGVKQSGVVLRYIVAARDRGLGVIFITHNPHHAYPVGDRFVVLNRGKLLGKWERGEISRADVASFLLAQAEDRSFVHEAVSLSA